MGLLEVTDVPGKDSIVARLRALADDIEATGGSDSAVCVIGPGALSDMPTVFVMGQDALAALMMASATLETFIDSIPSNATRL